VNRNLEPYRGFHIFMRMLPAFLKRRPKARVLITGGDEVSYGARPKGGGSWKDVMIREVRAAISDTDWSRVHFVGQLPYADFQTMMQLSTVHVYLTYPFVLSWSLLEAMSMECPIVASDTAPVREVIRHDETGYLTDFFDGAGLCDSVCALLDDPAARARLGASARAWVQTHYDLRSVCLPRQLKWVESLAG
jgi:glycosyltransferase involved in cell wall biosynthesis